jgi:hypothetical protein
LIQNIDLYIDDANFSIELASYQHSVNIDKHNYREILNIDRKAFVITSDLPQNEDEAMLIIQILQENPQVLYLDLYSDNRIEKLCNQYKIESQLVCNTLKGKDVFLIMEGDMHLFLHNAKLREFLCLKKKGSIFVNPCTFHIRSIKNNWDENALKSIESAYLKYVFNLNEPLRVDTLHKLYENFTKECSEISKKLIEDVCYSDLDSIEYFLYITHLFIENSCYRKMIQTIRLREQEWVNERKKEKTTSGFISLLK